MSSDIPSNLGQQPNSALLTKQLGIDRQPLMIAPETLLQEVIAQMNRASDTCTVDPDEENAQPDGRRSYALVTHQQKLMGIVTERDMVKLTAEGICFTTTSVEQVMTSNVITLKESDIKDAFTPLNLLRRYRIRHLPVVDGQNNICGVITSARLRERLPASALLKRRQVQEVMATHIITATPTTPVIDIATLMATHRVSCVVIQPSEDQPPQGIITEYDIVQMQRLELNLNQVTAETTMSAPLICLHPNDQLSDVQQKMKALRVRRLVVVNDRGRLVGLVTQTSVLSVLDPNEMAVTIEMLQQQVTQLQDERVQLLQARNARLETQSQARRHLEIRLRSAEQQMRAVVEAMHDVVLVCTMEAGEIVTIDIAPTTPPEPDNTSSSDLASQTIQFLWDNLKKEAGQHLQTVVATGETEKYEYSFHQEDKTLHFLASISSMSENAVLWVARDISDLKRAERALFREKELAQVTLESIGDAVITTDIQGNIYQFNAVAEQLTGWQTSEAKGRPLSEIFNIIHEETRQTVQNPIQQALREGQIVELASNTVLIARDHTEYGIEDSAAPIRDRNGNIIGAVMVFHDVTQSRLLRRKLSWQASHDPLTQLINRRKFDQVLRDTLQSVQQDEHQHVLCFLDLDQFKVINDTCGHTAGDELLRQVATLFQQSIRTHDILARIGGDEFAILLYDCPLNQATVIAETLRQSVQDFRFFWQDKAFSIGVSIGLVQLDIDSPNLGHVLSVADAACYAAKAKGRNRIQVYGVNDVELAQQRVEQ